eukprot:31495-Pelagococcus_subviridis.AAC.3
MVKNVRTERTREDALDGSNLVARRAERSERADDGQPGADRALAQPLRAGRRRGALVPVRHRLIDDEGRTGWAGGVQRKRQSALKASASGDRKRGVGWAERLARRERKSLRNEVHDANAVVRGPA